jgi:hypothetical protein
MRLDKTITLYRSGNRMVVDPTTSIVKEALEPELSYVAKRILFGIEKKMSMASGGGAIEETPFNCYTLDHRNRISTSFGFYDRVIKALKKRGYGVVIKDLTPISHPPSFFEPQWDRVFDPDSPIQLRYGQDEFLLKAAANIKERLPCRFDAVPGYGKGFLMSCLGLMYPRLKIHIATKRVPVLKDRLYPELCQYLPDVGICCGAMKRMGHRVQLFSFDSLHHSTGDADILIVDECITGDATVSTPSGPVPLRDVFVGCHVVCYDGTTTTVRRVTRVWRRGVRPVLLLRTSTGRTLRCTSNHPIATPSGWIAAGLLEPGCPVLTIPFAVVGRSGNRSGLLRDETFHPVLAGVGTTFNFSTAERSISSSAAEAVVGTEATCRGTDSVLPNIGSSLRRRNDRLYSERCWATRPLVIRTDKVALPGSLTTTAGLKNLGPGTRQISFDDFGLTSWLSRILDSATSWSARIVGAFRRWLNCSTWSGPVVETSESALNGWIRSAPWVSPGGCVTTEASVASTAWRCTSKDTTTTPFQLPESGYSVTSAASVFQKEELRDSYSDSAVTVGTPCGNSSTPTFPIACPTSDEYLIGIERLPHDEEVFDLEVEEHHNYFANGFLVHNCHESATDDACTQLAKYDRSINMGFSATHDMRLDNKDMRVEAMFGPIVYKIPYQEAVDHGLVVPIEVIWSDVIMDDNPVEEISDSVTRKRLGIWRNWTRNEIIAADARAEAEDGTQVLITCETIEHVLCLKKLLPDFEVVYAADGVDAEDERYFRQTGIWEDGMESMTQDRRDKITRMFEMGHVRKAICNTVWNVGVNFKQLGVLIRADAGGSPTMDTQIPGRTSRIDPTTGKLKGVVRDYRDQFDRGFKQRAARRCKSYASHGWRQLDASGQLLVLSDEDEDTSFRPRSRRGRDEPTVAKPPRRTWTRR